MISRIRGTVLARDLDRVEILTPGGVVYEVHVPLSVFQRLPAEGSELEILTAWLVLADVPHLYGFLDEVERSLFHRLMSVQKVGPKLAVAMLGAYDARRLARALAEQDIPALVQIPGLGKKTASRLVLELSDKVEDLAAASRHEGPAAQLASDAVAALVSLGYDFAEADAAVRSAMKDATFDSAGEIIRRALAARAANR